MSSVSSGTVVIVADFAPWSAAVLQTIRPDLFKWDDHR